MNTEDIKKVIDHFKDEGTNIRVRDIAYILLSKMFTDTRTAYQCLFGTDGYEDYDNDPMRESLEKYMSSVGYIRNISTDSETGGITFAENKREMEKMLDDIRADMDAGVIENDKGYSLMKDIRTKLNDKFKVESTEKDRTIIVERKFDFVCPYSKRECYQLDKETAMQKFNLIEKTQ